MEVDGLANGHGLDGEVSTDKMKTWVLQYWI